MRGISQVWAIGQQGKKLKKKKNLRSSSILATFPTYCLYMANSNLKILKIW
jgi:hypothetical protein